MPNLETQTRQLDSIYRNWKEWTTSRRVFISSYDRCDDLRESCISPRKQGDPTVYLARCLPFRSLSLGELNPNSSVRCYSEAVLLSLSASRRILQTLIAKWHAPELKDVILFNIGLIQQGKNCQKYYAATVKLWWWNNMFNLPVKPCQFYTYYKLWTIMVSGQVKHHRYMGYAAGTYLNIKRTNILKHLSSPKYMKNITWRILNSTVDPSSWTLLP